MAAKGNVMSDYDEHRIRERAYEIWVAEGYPEGRHAEHWHAASSEFGAKPDRSKKGKNEGEGNVTAAKAYNKATRKFIASGQVEIKAKQARKAIDGPEGPSLRQAEAAAKGRGRVASKT